MWICVGPRDPSTKPSRGWLRVVVRKPRLVLVEFRATWSKVSTNPCGVRGCEMGWRGATQWLRNAKHDGPFTTSCTITRGDLPLQKTIFCLATLLSRLLMHGSAVRGLRLIDTPRRGARDLSCLHGRDCAARKVRASASEVKDGGGYDHPLTHGPVFQRDKRIIERLGPCFGDSPPRKCRPEAAAPETRSQSLPFSN